MARWEPGAAERLQAAAFELFVTRGFEQTTAAEIAQSVGLTERTFFRHFRDKREVLFDAQNRLVNAVVSGAEEAPAGAAPFELVAAALRSAATMFPDDRRPHSRTRQSVIDGNPALQERERDKMADLASALAGVLRARGVAEPAATLAAQSGVSVFVVAFTQWIREGEERPFAELASTALGELLALAKEG